MKTEDWIDVKERLPEDYENVLWCKVPVVEPYYVGCVLDTDFIFDYYTHWMPLPQPPH